MSMIKNNVGGINSKRAALLQIATEQIGYTESPPGSNMTKFGAWFGLNGVPWCGIFVSWCYSQAGFPLPRIGFVKGFAGVQTAFEYFTNIKKFGTFTRNPKPGDIVLFKFGSRYDHTGLFVKDNKDGTFTTIEGNTGTGDDKNGGAVMERVRKYDYAVFIAITSLS